MEPQMHADERRLSSMSLSASICVPLRFPLLIFPPVDGHFRPGLTFPLPPSALPLRFFAGGPDSSAIGVPPGAGGGHATQSHAPRVAELAASRVPYPSHAV